MFRTIRRGDGYHVLLALYNQLAGVHPAHSYNKISSHLHFPSSGSSSKHALLFDNINRSANKDVKLSTKYMPIFITTSTMNSGLSYECHSPPSNSLLIQLMPKCFLTYPRKYRQFAGLRNSPRLPH